MMNKEIIPNVQFGFHPKHCPPNSPLNRLEKRTILSLPPSSTSNKRLLELGLIYELKEYF